VPMGVSGDLGAVGHVRSARGRLRQPASNLRGMYSMESMTAEATPQLKPEPGTAKGKKSRRTPPDILALRHFVRLMGQVPPHKQAAAVRWLVAIYLD
jgi:hypothetical protein